MYRDRCAGGCCNHLFLEWCSRRGALYRVSHRMGGGGGCGGYMGAKGGLGALAGVGGEVGPVGPPIVRKPTEEPPAPAVR